VQTRVRLDLNSARAAYDNHIDGIARFLQAAALDGSLEAGLRDDKTTELEPLLKKVYATRQMDFLVVLDGAGRVIYRPRNPDRGGDDLSGNPVIAQVLKTGSASRGTIILSHDELLSEGPELAEKARFDLLPTPAARPTKDKVRADGMVAAAAVPVVDADGRLLGILYGGDLLNRRYEIVDAIKDEVFPGQVFEGRDIGTVTIFQWDLRVSTNVTRNDGSRAVGTRVSDAVYAEVLERGGTWARPAFVVNDWYITAYEPIRDPTDRIIGILYVGLLQAPFMHQRNMLTGIFLAMVLATTLASLVLLFFVTMLVLRPIGRIITMTRQVAGGDLGARVSIRPPGEMGSLCRAVDSMADAVAEREEQLKRITRAQVGRSEKLASIGRLAAGVAHEINNPLTGVLTFAHLLREKENLDPQDKEDLDTIIHETSRAANIVRGLLDFAREGKAVTQRLSVNDVVQKTVRLLGNQEVFRQVMVVEDLQADLPPVDGDMNQLQQVLLNLALNACEAMQGGGTLLLSTATRDGQVLLKVADTGCGIPRKHLDQIFEPFFSTKPVGKGTGLGLSVSYGIVQQHGGTIEVESEEGKGTTFTVILPAVGQGPRQAASGDPPGGPKGY
jgi:two-component system NtrC family sensor kinase